MFGKKILAIFCFSLLGAAMQNYAMEMENNDDWETEDGYVSEAKKEESPTSLSASDLENLLSCLRGESPTKKRNTDQKEPGRLYKAGSRPAVLEEVLPARAHIDSERVKVFDSEELKREYAEKQRIKQDAKRIKQDAKKQKQELQEAKRQDGVFDALVNGLNNIRISVVVKEEDEEDDEEKGYQQQSQRSVRREPGKIDMKNFAAVNNMLAGNANVPQGQPVRSLPGRINLGAHNNIKDHIANKARQVSAGDDANENNAADAGVAANDSGAGNAGNSGAANNSGTDTGNVHANESVPNTTGTDTPTNKSLLSKVFSTKVAIPGVIGLFALYKLYQYMITTELQWNLQAIDSLKSLVEQRENVQNFDQKFHAIALRITLLDRQVLDSYLKAGSYRDLIAYIKSDSFIRSLDDAYVKKDKSQKTVVRKMNNVTCGLRNDCNKFRAFAHDVKSLVY